MLLVCLNPTMDRQVFLSELRLGSVARAITNRRMAGGKPIDVRRAMAAHGAAPQLLVALPEAGEDYTELLAAEGIAADIVRVPGVLRETVVLYEESGRATVINGRGPHVDADTRRTLSAEVTRRAADHRWVVLSGSFPPGYTDDDVRTLVEDLRAAGTRVALDTGPGWLRAALPAGPDLITPNLAEAQQLGSAGPAVEAVEFGATALADAQAAARGLADAGIPYVVVTAGSAGAAWATADDSGTRTALPVDTVNPIGAGDAFLGGILARIDRDDFVAENFADAVAWGAATAASAVRRRVPGQADAAEVAEFRRRLA
jgi:1-phosphofructokinase family hexose kinase